MLTDEQRIHNYKLDAEILKAEMEQKLYEVNCKIKREKFLSENPHFPIQIAETIFLPVIGKRCIVGIRYVE